MTGGTNVSGSGASRIEEHRGFDGPTSQRSARLCLLASRLSTGREREGSNIRVGAGGAGS